jgi:hypothetical protein
MSSDLLPFYKFLLLFIPLCSSPWQNTFYLASGGFRYDFSESQAALEETRRVKLLTLKG